MLKMSHLKWVREVNMANERLRDAMKAAHVSLNDIVEAANVDRRTVQRWMKGSTPNENHRWIIAEFLNMREDVLWPTDKSDTEIKPVSSAEVIATYAHRSDVPPSMWWHLFMKARRNIDLLGYALVFLPEQHRGLTDLLKKKAMASCTIRIAIADPTSTYVQERDREERLGGTLAARIQTTLYHFQDILDCPGIEVRFHSTPLYNSVFRFDNEMFTTPHLFGLHGSKTQLQHLHRLQSDGIFASHLSHFEAVWATTKPVHLGNLIEQFH
jgi:transcriptional regulator with XRE-family HTH domain